MSESFDDIQGFFAMPTGILSAGFVEEIRKVRESEKVCPHCGNKLG